LTCQLRSPHSPGTNSAIAVATTSSTFDCGRSLAPAAVGTTRGNPEGVQQISGSGSQPGAPDHDLDGESRTKKVLCGTTALVAAGLLAGEASAASGLKLGITGFYRGAAGATIGGDSEFSQVLRLDVGPLAIIGTGQGDYGRTSGGFRQEIRINFTGETTLDNGLTVGVLVGLNGENLLGYSSAPPVKQSWVDFKGKFGDVRFGEFTGAMGQNCIYDPGDVTSNFGINSPNESFSNGCRDVFAGSAITVGVRPHASARSTGASARRWCGARARHEAPLSPEHFTIGINHVAIMPSTSETSDDLQATAAGSRA
jgi:hypothetical protein